MVFTEEMGGLEYAWHTFLGATCGDICPQDSVAWLLGSIGSGIAIYGDVRDLIVSIFKLDAVGFGINLVGVVPLGGDALKSVGKVVEFLRRVPRRVDDVLYTMLRSDLPDWAKLRILETAFGGVTSKLRAAAVPDDAIRRLASSRSSFRLLEGVTARPGSSAPASSTGARRKLHCARRRARSRTRKASARSRACAAPRASASWTPGTTCSRSRARRRRASST